MVAALLMMTTAACGSDTPRIETVHGTADSPRLVVGVDDCNAHPTATVEESEAEVRILVHANRSWGDPDCADSVAVTLDRPLGTRAVVDAATDRRVEVLPPAT
ncbi:hypothetical protein [Oryzobacter telluris]|uniref:hypothetical protein n=1 Tax=Oryzobacter telluris TaxID=3149179 RepID=UPI00370D8C42